LNNVSVLYGGSVNSKNITGFLDYEAFNGFLVGKSSINQQEVEALIKNFKR